MPADSIAVPVACAASFAASPAFAAASFASCFISAVVAVSIAGTVVVIVVVLDCAVPVESAVVVVSVRFSQAKATRERARIPIIVFRMRGESATAVPGWSHVTIVTRFRDRLPRGRPAAAADFGAMSTMAEAATARVAVRNLEHTDLPDVVRIDAEAGGRRRAEYFELMLMRALNFAGLQMSLVAEIDGRIAGYLIASLYYGEYGISEPTASIDAIGVERESRRSGVGRALLREFREKAAAIGVSIVRTEVQWDDFDLLAFFRGEEFVPAGRICLERKAEG